MANILDYIDWRGDLPFTRDPINSIDLLIFSVLAYTDMDDLFKGDRELALPQLAYRYDKAGVDQSSLVYNPKPTLMKAADTPRFSNVLVSRYVDLFDKETETQFAAVTFQISHTTTIVAYRGTDNTITGWREDFNATYQKTHAQELAMRYLNQIMDEEIYVCGHSKGGNLAVYASSFCNKEVQDRIVSVINFDGPGFLENVLNSQGYQNILTRSLQYIPESSVVGLLMSQRSRRIIVQSTANLYMQHDPYSWKVLGNDFEKKEQLSAFSQYVEEILGRWLKDTSVEEKKKFVDTLFNALESSGAETFNEINNSKAETAYSVIKSLRDIGRKDIKAVGDTLVKLAQNTGNVIMKDIKNYVKKVSPDSTNKDDDKDNDDKKDDDK